jgi:hypothetical protein
MHIASDKKQKEVWLYNYKLGWRKTNKATVEKLMDTTSTLKDRYEAVKTLYNLSETN